MNPGHAPPATAQKPTLLVLAAGMGSRYGGLKQIDPVGPDGETIIDYSIFDALRAGFGKVVFVIRRDIEAAFKETIGARFEQRADVRYVFQELDMLPPGFSVPAGRTKPWGTGHAILLTEPAIAEPFAVINGDDFYGRDSFRVLAEHLRSGTHDYAMVGFQLRKTVSEHGSVARGVTRVGADDLLQSVVELTGIEKDFTGGREVAGGAPHTLTGDEMVSMNMWGFTPTIFDHLREQLAAFLQQHGQEQKSEFYIPTAVNTILAMRKRQVRVLRTADAWFGITYRDDRPHVVESVRRLIARGDYPERLWT